jgi:hypothetical protein
LVWLVGFGCLVLVGWFWLVGFDLVGFDLVGFDLVGRYLPVGFAGGLGQIGAWLV